MEGTKRLTRSSTEKVVAGVCGGIAEYFDMDPTLVRVAYVVFSIFSAAFPGLIFYVILAAIMPQR